MCNHTSTGFLFCQAVFGGFGDISCGKPHLGWSQHLGTLREKPQGLSDWLFQAARVKTVSLSSIVGLLGKGGLTYGSDLKVTGDLRIYEAGNSCFGFCEIACQQAVRSRCEAFGESGGSALLDQAFQVALGLCLRRIWCSESLGL